jgi:hypothetical protein
MAHYADRFGIDRSGIARWQGQRVDLVMLLEVLEHYADPEAFFANVIDAYCGRYLLWSAPFGWLDAGHFRSYCGVEGARYTARFNRFLAKCGFVELAKGFNNRMSLWERG